jgi:hypothetical protein
MQFALQTADYVSFLAAPRALMRSNKYFCCAIIAFCLFGDIMRFIRQNINKINAADKKSFYNSSQGWCGGSL